MMPGFRKKPSKTYKWKVLHNDDGEEEARYFQSKGDAIYYIELLSGYMLSEVKQ